MHNVNTDILLSIIGTLLLILLSLLGWALKTLHNDLKELARAQDKENNDIRENIEAINSLTLRHDTTLYGAHGNNGLMGDVKHLKEQLERRRNPR